MEYGERRYFLTTRPVISGMNTARFDLGDQR